MALIPIRIPRTTKPSLSTPIDWGNPLAQGLVGAWAFNEGSGTKTFDAVSGITGVKQGATSWHPEGIRNSGGTPAGIIFASGVANPQAASTMFCAGSFTDFSAIRTIGVLGAHSLVIQANGTLKYGVSTSLTYPSVYSTALTGVVSSCAGTFGGVGGTHDIYVNGLAAKASQVAGTGIIGGGPSGAIGCASSGNAYAQVFNGIISVVLFFSRALSPSEIASLSANPWQIYEPEITWGEATSTSIPATGHNLYTLVGGELKQFTAFKALIDGTVKDLTLYTLVGGIVKPLTTAEAINAFLREDAGYILREDGTRFAREA